MLRVLLLVVVGVPAGFLLGSVWISAAMSAAGGGNAHNDLIIQALSGMLGAVLGPVLPLALRTLYRGGVGESAPASQVAVVWGIVRIAVVVTALFVTTALYYYATCIAELSPDRGGPISDIPGAVRSVRALWGAGAGLVISVAAVWLPGTRATSKTRSTGAP